MRYLTFTALPSGEVRKAILRHRSDVLQIAAIYSATREKHLTAVGGARNFCCVLYVNVYAINQLTLIIFFHNNVAIVAIALYFYFNRRRIYEKSQREKER